MSSNLSCNYPQNGFAEWLVVNAKKVKSLPLGKNRLVGYARVSTREQTLDLQIDALKAAGVHEDNLWVEKVSGAASKRPERDKAMIDARDGDTFIVWRLDRVGRRIMEVYELVEDLRKRNIKFISLTENFDLSTATGKLAFGMAALWAEFERNVTIERTMSGMKAAAARGRPAGRESKLSKAQWATAEKLLAKGWTPSEVAAKYKVARQTIYMRFPSAKIAELRGEGEQE